MKKILSVFFLACCSCIVMAQDNVIDEIVWVVGDDAILRSDIETQRLYNQNEGVRLDGDPYCVIPEQMAIQKLYLNQAKIDSITVNENQVIQSVDQWMNMAVNQIGSREKLEEYFGKKFSQIKDERKEMVREQQVVQQMQHQLIGEIKLTPSEVRKYFSQLSQDSLPNIPTTVEVQIVTLEPKIPFEETDAIKARLRDFTEQVNSGKMEFSTLARLYSGRSGFGVSRRGVRFHEQDTAVAGVRERCVQLERPETCLPDRTDGVWLPYHPIDREAWRPYQLPPYLIETEGFR